MANDVFANGREISCKAGSGKSIAAFPDVCFTPPENPATPPGVPLPYPNNGMTSDTTSGSKTVKVSKKECMLKNKSYFKKSSGDEAGSAAKKGVVTSVNRGKVYFNAWSSDVKFEGENVVRHLDITTHNHASFPGNSPTWPFLDSAAFAGEGPCAEVAEGVEEHCLKTETDDSGEEVHTLVFATKKDDVKRKPSIEEMCDDPKCNEAMKCVLSPESPSNCCDGKTPHHLIAAHCFMDKGERGKSNEAVYDGCEGYNSKKAPCLCVEGQSKIGEHGDFHEYFDDIEDSYMEDDKAGSWTYAEARYAAVETVEENSDCDPACSGTQLDAYHQGGGTGPNISDDTPLRADSTGLHTPEGFTPSVTDAMDVG